MEHDDIKVGEQYKIIKVKNSDPLHGFSDGEVVTCINKESKDNRDPIHVLNSNRNLIGFTRAKNLRKAALEIDDLEVGQLYAIQNIRDRDALNGFDAGEVVECKGKDAFGRCGVAVSKLDRSITGFTTVDNLEPI